MARGKNQRSREAMRLSVTNEVIEDLREEIDVLHAEIDRKNLEIQQLQTKTVANAQGMAYERTNQLRQEAYEYAEEIKKDYEHRAQKTVDRLANYFQKFGIMPVRAHNSSADSSELASILEELGTTYGQFLNRMVSKGGRGMNRNGRRASAKSVRRQNATFNELAAKGLNLSHF